MMPDVEYTSSGIDEEQWQVFDCRDGSDVKRFIECLSIGTRSRWESVYGSLPDSKLPSVDDVRYLASILRGDFEKDVSAIHRIESIAAELGRAYLGRACKPAESTPVRHDGKFNRFADYCRKMKMTYSYKPVLILALLHAGDDNGCITMSKAVVYFRSFYADRRSRGLPVELKPCIYLHDDTTDRQIMENLIANPVKALCKSGFFTFAPESSTFSFLPEIWDAVSKGRKVIETICHEKLKDYYSQGKKCINGVHAYGEGPYT